MDPVVWIVLVLVTVAAAVAATVVVRRRAGGEPAPRPSDGAAAPTPHPRGEGLGARVRALFAGGPAEDAWERLEDLLIRADVGPGAAAAIVGRVRDHLEPGSDPEALVVEEITAALGGDDPSLRLAADGLAVVLVVGVNGSGKTTTIGKLAKRLADEGRRVSLAGSDTFRAAAAEQLHTWAERAGAHLVSQERGADPSAVAFDAVKAALARGSDVLVVDTAGRLHTKTPLMDELRKVRRVIEKAGGEIRETLLVLDATTGQNGIAQARAFTEAVEVTGVVLTKLDGTAGGGIVVAVREELGVPVKLIGVGEGIDDLRAFDASAFAERMVRS